MIPLLLIAAAFSIPGFTLIPDVCTGVDQLHPYYIIPTGSGASLIALPVSLPPDDTVTAVSSLPASLEVDVVANDLIELRALAGPHANPCSPDSPDQTVTITDSQGLLSMVMKVDISP